MDKDKAIQMIKDAIDEIPHLRSLNHSNQKFKLWRDKIENILEVAFGMDSWEYRRFAQAVILYWGRSDAELQEAYNSYLNSYETALKSIIQKYELLGTETKPSIVAQPPKVFISHGKEKRLFEKAWKIEIRGDDIATLYPIVRTVASELRLENFAFEARPAKSMATDNFAWFNVLIINRTTMNTIPIGAFTLQSPGINRTVLRVPPCSEWGRYDLSPGELAVMAYSGSQYDGYFLEFIKRLENKLKDDGLIVTRCEKLWYEFKDFIATIIAKLVAEKTK